MNQIESYDSICREDLGTYFGGWCISDSIYVGKTSSQIAESVHVAKTNIQRTVALFEETGDVQKQKRASNDAMSKLSEIGKLLILELVIVTPGIYLREIKGELR